MIDIVAGGGVGSGVTQLTCDGTVFEHDQMIKGIMTSIIYNGPIGTIWTLITT